jgi:molecular chaperone GrpE
MRSENEMHSEDEKNDPQTSGDEVSHEAASGEAALGEDVKPNDDAPHNDATAAADNPETDEAPQTDDAENAEARIAALNDQLLRTLAELENARKRAARDRSEALKFGAMSFARDMLSVADNLQRALKAGGDMDGEVKATMSGLIEGVAATERELLAALARHKVTPLAPMGEKFDPNLHEAMFEAPGTGQESGTIIEVIETGYMMEERLLRPAKVGIAKD